MGVKIDVYIKYVIMQSSLCMHEGLVAAAPLLPKSEGSTNRQYRWLTVPRINTSVKSLEAICSNGTTIKKKKKKTLKEMH